MRTRFRSAVLLLVAGGATLGLSSWPGGGSVATNPSGQECGGCPPSRSAPTHPIALFAAPATASEVDAELQARKKGTVFASSNFDEDTEGWIFDDGSPRTPIVVPSGGARRGGGFLEATPSEALDPVWIAPASFRGDKRDATLGTLTYFQKSASDTTPINVRVAIIPNNSNNSPIVYTDQFTPDPDDRGWTQIDVPLDARDHNWKLRTNGQIFPPYFMLCVLSDIKQIVIAANVDNGPRFSLDEVKLVGAKPKPEKPKAEPKKLNFGKVSIVQSAVDSVQITNNGKGLLHLRLLTTQAGPFKVERSPFDIHCIETLLPGDFGPYIVTFKPTKAGHFAEKIFFEIGPPGNTQKVFLKVSGDGFVP